MVFWRITYEVTAQPIFKLRIRSPAASCFRQGAVSSSLKHVVHLELLVKLASHLSISRPLWTSSGQRRVPPVTDWLRRLLQETDLGRFTCRILHRHHTRIQARLLSMRVFWVLRLAQLPATLPRQTICQRIQADNKAPYLNRRLLCNLPSMLMHTFQNLPVMEILLRWYHTVHSPPQERGAIRPLNVGQL